MTRVGVNGLHEQLLQDEGLRTDLYEVNGIPHIGMGHNLRAKPISRHAAQMIAADDEADAVADVLFYFPWAQTLDEPRRGVLYNLAFNMGAGGLLTFHRMLAALQAGDYSGAARELRDSDHQKQLPERNERLAVQLETGVWQ